MMDNINTSELLAKWKSQIDELHGCIDKDGMSLLILSRLQPLIDSNEEFKVDFSKHQGYVLVDYVVSDKDKFFIPGISRVNSTKLNVVVTADTRNNLTIVPTGDIPQGLNDMFQDWGYELGEYTGEKLEPGLYRCSLEITSIPPSGPDSSDWDEDIKITNPVRIDFGLSQGLSFVKNRNIDDYKLVLDGLSDEFGVAFSNTILIWCQKTIDTGPDYFWEIWAIVKSPDTPTDTPKVIGICGLYAQVPDSVEQLWLGWFGVIPEYRDKGYGTETLRFIEHVAKSKGCKELYSYVSKDGKPLAFYYKNGFERIGTAKRWLEFNPIPENEIEYHFENMDDHIIRKSLE